MWITSRSRDRSWLRLLAPLALTVPLAVAVEVPEDSTVTEIRVTGGTGSYLAVTRDCSGDITQSEPVDYGDIGISIEHLSGTWGVGLGAGYVSDDVVSRDYTNTYPPGVIHEDIGFYYVAPSIQISGKSVGASAGMLVTTRELPLTEKGSLGDERSGTSVYPSVSLRIGNPESVYLSGHLFSMLPIYSGGDYLAAGIGILPAPWCRAWTGIGSNGLYSDTGFLLQGDFQVSPGWWLGFNSRYGSNENYGLGLSIAYRRIGER